MELMKIDMPLPEEILSLNDEIKQLLSQVNENTRDQFAIAGGCISNLYMNKPYHDIDVFVQFEAGKEKKYESLFKQAFGHSIEIETHEMPVGLYTFVECPLLFRFMYRETPIEIIFCTDLDRIYDFDIRMRQFYFINDEVLTTALALEDIACKRLAIGAPCSPITTFIRLHHFKEELGFDIDEESKNVLLWFMSKNHFEFKRVMDTIEKRKKMNPKAKAELEAFFSSHRSEDVVDVIEVPEPSFPFNRYALSFFESLIRSSDHSTGIKRNLGFAQLGVIGRNYEKLKTFEPSFEPFDVQVELPHEKVWEKGVELLQFLYGFMRKKRLEILFTKGPFSYHNKWKKQNNTLSTQEYQEVFFHYLDLFETPSPDTVRTFSEDLRNQEKSFVVCIFNSMFESIRREEETPADSLRVQEFSKLYHLLTEETLLLNLHVTSKLSIHALSEQTEGGALVEITLGKSARQKAAQQASFGLTMVTLHYHAIDLLHVAVGKQGVTEKKGVLHSLLAPLVSEHVHVHKEQTMLRIS